jgi:hypothetical protein
MAPVRIIGCFDSSASPSDRSAKAGSHSLRTPLHRMLHRSEHPAQPYKIVALH